MERRFVLQGMETRASIGIYDHERKAPQRLIIDAELLLSPATEPLDDQIESTLDYEIIREMILDIVSVQHYDLQETLARKLFDALQSLKAQDVVSLDVTGISDVMDNLVIATGTSNRHVKSLANNVVDELKQLGLKPIGIEGLESADWVLVDYGSVVVHVMLSQTRQFYDLEKLWTPIDNPVEE